MDKPELNLMGMVGPSSVSPGRSIEIKDAIDIRAVILAHSKLTEEFGEEQRPTLRQLFRTYCPEVKGVLLEYACGFGVHGLTVLHRYVTRQVGPCSQEIQDNVIAQFTTESEKKAYTIFQQEKSQIK